MSSTPKPNESTANASNRSLGKRKKTQRSKGSYLSKWLDKTMHHVQDPTPSMDTYDSIINGNLNWPMGGQFAAAGFDPARLMYAQEPMSLPTVPTYYNPALLGPYCGPDYRYVQSANKSIQVQRPRQRLRSEHKAEEVHCTPMGTPNGTLNKSHYSKAFSDDFASLPPIVTSVGDTTSNSDLNTNEKDDNSNARRYSDPCVQGLPDVARPANGDVDSGSDDSSGLSGSQVGTRLLSCLIDQITTLKMANEKLSKELQDTKAELASSRQQNSIWQKSTSSSVGGTPNHSPLANNGLLGASYAPGLLVDLVREIRDAARVREEALYTRVRAMVHERTDNGMSCNDKFSERSLEDIKSSLRASEADKRRMMERISKLEDELRLQRVSSGLDSHENGPLNGSLEDVEVERLRMRKEVADMRRQKLHAEEHALKLERLVTQLRSKFNGLQLSPNGPESIASDPERGPSPRDRRPSEADRRPSEADRRPSEADRRPSEADRVRRTSLNSSSNSTVVFGPVTDL